MHIADLVFLLVVFATVIALLRIAYLGFAGRGAAAGRAALRTGVILAVYLTVVVVVGLASPRKWVALGEEQRYDDWAITVRKAARTDSGYAMTIAVANHGLGRPQAERGAEVVLITESGARIHAAEAPGERSIQTTLQPGESFETIRTYKVPSSEAVVGARVIHGAWPGWFIVGDEQSLLHKRPLVRLD